MPRSNWPAGWGARNGLPRLFPIRRSGICRRRSLRVGFRRAVVGRSLLARQISLVKPGAVKRREILNAEGPERKLTAKGVKRSREGRKESTDSFQSLT